MSDEMRLPEVVAGYANYYGVDVPEAAYALHELIAELYQEYGVRQGKVALPGHVFWVGRADSSRHSIRKYKIFFGGILSYFDSLYDSVWREGSDLIPTYCESDKNGRDLPANLIFLSKKALAEWLEQAGGEAPQFLLVDDVSARVELNNDGQGVQAKELGSISLIISGLVNLIKEVDKAHTERPVDSRAEKRAEAIKRRAAGLRSSRKNFDLCSAILALADAAETDMPKSHKTLKKYMASNVDNSSKEPL
jgi:hypothetical protein